MMLNICDRVAIDKDLTFNTSKCVWMRIGARVKESCGNVYLSQQMLKCVQSLRYSGVNIISAKKFKCCYKVPKTKFCRALNQILVKCKGINGDIIVYYKFYVTRYCCMR